MSAAVRNAPDTRPEARIDPTAQVHATAMVEAGAAIGPNVNIRPKARSRSRANVGWGGEGWRGSRDRHVRGDRTQGQHR